MPVVKVTNKMREREREKKKEKRKEKGQLMTENPALINEGGQLHRLELYETGILSNF